MLRRPPEFAVAQQPAQDLAAAGSGQFVLKPDRTRRHRRSQSAAGVGQQLAAERLVRVEAGLQRDQSFDQLAQGRVRQADGDGISDGRLFQQGACAGSGPNTKNSGEKTQPAFSVPSAVT